MKMKEQKWTTLIIGVGLWGLISAWGVIWDTDAVYYHILVPKKMWLYGQTFGGVLHPNSSRPLLIPSIDAILYGCGGVSSISVFRLWMGIGLLLSFVQRGGTKIGLFLLLGSASFLHEFGLYGYNILAAFGIWLTYHLSIQKYHPMILGILAGTTLSIKYTSLGPLLAIWCCGIPFLLKKDKVDLHLKYRMLSVIPVIAIVMIWPFRNIIESLHPIFPYAGWTEDFQMLEKYGMGRSWKDFLLLPYNVLVHAKPYSEHFLGRIHPLWALVLPLGIKAREYKLLAICSLCCIFWAIGPQWIRHLVVFLPLCALLFKKIEKRNMIWFWGAYVILLPWQLSWSLIDIEQKIQSLFEPAQRESFQEHQVPGWNVGVWAKENTPQDAKIAFFYAWTGIATDRFVVLGSVEEHIPSRDWLITHGDTSLMSLKQQGIEFVVVGPPPKHEAGWSFLSKKDFHARFIIPQNILQKCLLRDAVMLYEHKGFSLYRIRN